LCQRNQATVKRESKIKTKATACLQWNNCKEIESIFKGHPIFKKMVDNLKIAKKIPLK